MHKHSTESSKRGEREGIGKFLLRRRRRVPGESGAPPEIMFVISVSSWREQRTNNQRRSSG
jgi:hypothetical protein